MCVAPSISNWIYKNYRKVVKKITEKLENPNIKTRVVHSKTKQAWNVIGVTLGKKHKIAVVPYADFNKVSSHEAFLHAEFISHCFNNSGVICEFLNRSEPI